MSCPGVCLAIIVGWNGINVLRGNGADRFELAVTFVVAVIGLLCVCFRRCGMMQPMQPHVYATAICWICGERQEGRFTDRQQSCDRHSSEERDFFMAMDMGGPLTKADRAMRRAYMLRWRKPYVQAHLPVKEVAR